MTPQTTLPYAVFRQLLRERVTLRASAEFGEGLAAPCGAVTRLR